MDHVRTLPWNGGTTSKMVQFVVWRLIKRTITGTCTKFYYGGCGGNANLHETEQDCKNACGNHVGMLTVCFLLMTWRFRCLSVAVRQRSVWRQAPTLVLQQECPSVWRVRLWRVSWQRKQLWVEGAMRRTLWTTLVTSFSIANSRLMGSQLNVFSEHLSNNPHLFNSTATHTIFPPRLQFQFDN